MTFRKSVAVRDAQNNAIELVIGPSPVLKIRSGPPPAKASDADAGDLLATIDLPANWLLSSSEGVVRMSGSWKTTASAATGTAGHFRIYSSIGVAHLQGTVGLKDTLPLGDMTLDKVALVSGDPVTIINFAITAGNG